MASAKGSPGGGRKKTFNPKAKLDQSQMRKARPSARRGRANHRRKSPGA